MVWESDFFIVCEWNFMRQLFFVGREIKSERNFICGRHFQTSGIWGSGKFPIFPGKIPFFGARKSGFWALFWPFFGPNLGSFSALFSPFSGSKLGTFWGNSEGGSKKRGFRKVGFPKNDLFWLFFRGILLFFRVFLEFWAPVEDKKLSVLGARICVKWFPLCSDQKKGFEGLRYGYRFRKCTQKSHRNIHLLKGPRENYGFPGFRDPRSGKMGTKSRFRGTKISTEFGWKSPVSNKADSESGKSGKSGSRPEPGSHRSRVHKSPPYFLKCGVAKKDPAGDKCFWHSIAGINH